MSKKKNNIEIKIKPEIKVPIVRKSTQVHEDKRFKEKYKDNIEIDEIDLEYEKVKREYDKKRLSEKEKYDKTG